MASAVMNFVDLARQAKKIVNFLEFFFNLLKSEKFSYFLPIKKNQFVGTSE